MLDEPLRKNYDYGEGLYQNMHDYKSVADFLKKKRKARRKKLLSVHMDKNHIDFPLDQYLPEEYTGQSGLSGYSDKVNSDQYYTLPDEKVVKLREDGNPTHYIEGDPDLIPFLN